jgi:hypothetical protein
LFEEKACQLVSVTQALQTRRHVAGVSKVCESNKSILSIPGLLHLNSIEFTVNLCAAVRIVESFVLLKTIIIAIAHTLAHTLYSELVASVAPLALANHDAILFRVLIDKLRMTILNKKSFFSKFFVLKNKTRTDHGFN